MADVSHARSPHGSVFGQALVGVPAPSRAVAFVVQRSYIDLKKPGCQLQITTLIKGLPVSFRLADESKAALEKAAADDARSVSSLLTKIVNDYLRDKGYLPS